MIIDSHAHLEERLMDIQSVLKEMDKNSISKMVLVSHLTDPPESVKPKILMNIQRKMFNSNILRPLAIKITQSMYKKDGEWDLKVLKHFMKTDNNKLKIIDTPDNKCIEAALNGHPDRFYGLVFVNPTKKNTLQELSTYSKKSNFVGIKLHPFWHKYPISKIKDVAQYALDNNLYLNIHLGLDQGEQYQWIFDNFPNNKIVFGHLGVPYYKKLWPHILNFKNYYMDVASTYHVDESLIKSAYKIVGAKRLIFGTDTPYTENGSMKKLLSWIKNLNLTQEEEQLIFFKNFQGLIGDRKIL